MNPESFLFGDTSDLNFLSRMPGAVCLPIFICRTFIHHPPNPSNPFLCPAAKSASNAASPAGTAAASAQPQGSVCDLVRR